MFNSRFISPELSHSSHSLHLPSKAEPPTSSFNFYSLSQNRVEREIKTGRIYLITKYRGERNHITSSLKPEN